MTGVLTIYGVLLSHRFFQYLHEGRQGERRDEVECLFKTLNADTLLLHVFQPAALQQNTLLHIKP